MHQQHVIPRSDLGLYPQNHDRCQRPALLGQIGSVTHSELYGQDRGSVILAGDKVEGSERWKEPDPWASFTGAAIMRALQDGRLRQGSNPGRGAVQSASVVTMSSPVACRTPTSIAFFLWAEPLLGREQILQIEQNQVGLPVGFHQRLGLIGGMVVNDDNL